MSSISKLFTTFVRSNYESHKYSTIKNYCL